MFTAAEKDREARSGVLARQTSRFPVVCHQFLLFRDSYVDHGLW